MEKVRLEIVIEVNKEDTDLFAVGFNDLRSYFIPNWMNVKESDVKKCVLYIVDKDGIYTHYHKDNYIAKGESILDIIGTTSKDK